MVAEEGDGAVLAGEGDDAVGIGAAVDEVAEEDELVVGGEAQAGEQGGQFGAAAVHVSDGDKATLHVEGKFASFTGEGK